MNIIYVLLIGVALSMDAFGVSLGIGVNSIINKRKKIGYILSFSFFQFLFSLIGGIAGYLFDTYIVPIPHIFGGIIIGIIGFLMILDGFKSKEKSIINQNSMMIILGISVSIDALVFGFTIFHHIGGLVILFIDCILIGLITLLLCSVSFFICRYVRKINFISRYADFLGGCALILFAIKMIFF